MPIRDVEVNITRETQSVTQAGFGLPLILATNTDHDYTTYSDLESLAEDFDEETEAYKIANRIFGQSPRPSDVAVLGVSYDSETDEPSVLTSALNDNAKEDFYFLLCEEQGQDEIEALSEWIDAQRKLYFYDSDDPSIHAGLESDRTIPFIHSEPGDYGAAGWIGVCAPADPGSLTWKFKTINGLTDAGYSTSEVDDIIDDGGNTYIRQGGILHTYDGRVTSGEWIDVMRSQDYIEARMKENVFRTLVTAPKVPFTSAGIAQIVATVEGVLQRAYNNGMIADDEDGQPIYSVSAPKRSEVSANNRANRTLPDVEFSFELAGAVHEVEITGVIQV